MRVANGIVGMKGRRVPEVNHPWGGPGLDRLSLWGDWRPVGNPPEEPEGLGIALLGALPVAILAFDGGALALNCDYATFEVPNGIPGSDAMFTAYGVRVVPNRPVMVSVREDCGHRHGRVIVTSERVTLEVAGKVHAEIYLGPVLGLGSITPPPSVLAKLVPTPA